jgi:diacylglycerol kinase family enzyme
MVLEGAGNTAAEQRPSPLVASFRRIEMVVNPLAGSAGAQSVDEARQILHDFGLVGEVRAVGADTLSETLRAAIQADPDLLIILAGDGTARAAANLCGADGPVLVPLPGGTMNMLPHALYGPGDWKTALADTLATGHVTPVSGGAVDDRRFYVAAILGAPALWAEAREAARHGQLGLAWRKGQNALRRAFSSKLRFALDGRDKDSAEALTLMCPLVSRAMSQHDQALEAAVLNPAGAAEAFRLGFRALLSEAMGDWRDDPAVATMRCLRGEAWASSHIPAILDGEPVRLHKRVQIQFVPLAFRALVPDRAAPVLVSEPPCA